MSTVSRNVAANIAGTAMMTVLTLVMTPIQIRILGIEAFGVLGFVLTLQMALTAFDFGLAATLTREIAADRTETRQSTNTLIQTSMTVYWAMAVVIGVVFFVLAERFSRYWFNSTQISPADLARALQVIAIFLALRWPVSMYIGILTGLQRLDVLNLIKVGALAIRLVGGVVVLLHWRTLDAFLWWTVANAFIEIIAYDLGCRRVYPALPVLPGFSLTTVKRIWRFSLTMNALAILAVLLTQIDRIAISKAATLEVLGFYNLAYTVASILTLLTGAIASAALPWFAEAHAAGDLDRLQSQFLRANWITLYLTGLPAGALIFFGEPLLALWVNADAASGAAASAAVLAGAFWLSALVSNCYNVTVAQGNPRRPLILGALSVGPYFILMFFAVREYGAVGAAVVWLLLQISNVVFLIPHVLGHNLELKTWPWFTKSAVPILILVLVSFGVPKAIAYYTNTDSLVYFLLSVVLAGVAYLIGGYFLAPRSILTRDQFFAQKAGK